MAKSRLIRGVKSPLTLCKEERTIMRRSTSAASAAQSPELRDLAEAFAVARINQGRKQESLAAELGVTASTLRRWENSQAVPSFAQILAWGKSLGALWMVMAPAAPFPTMLGALPSWVVSVPSECDERVLKDALATLHGTGLAALRLRRGYVTSPGMIEGKRRVRYEGFKPNPF